MTRSIGTLLFALTLAACGENAQFPTQPAAFDPQLGKPASSSNLYQLQFTVGDPNSQGEITSDLFPAGGVQLNEKDPWRDLDVAGATWSLNNHTHGTWGQGTCTQDDVPVNWDIGGTDPVRSFAGTWAGDVKFWRNRGMHFYLDGNRTTGSGAIDNIASNNNATTEADGVDPDTGKRWFKITFTDARLKFGGASYPDDQGTLADLPGVEAACANFTVTALQM